MARVNYLGLTDPIAHFEKLEPYRRALKEAMLRYRPSGPEYLALNHAILSLDMAANLITGRLQFYDTGFRDTAGVGGGWKT